MSKTSTLCGPLQPAFYPSAAKRPALVMTRLRYGLVLVFGAVAVLGLLQPSVVFAQGANASPPGQPFQALQAESREGDQELQKHIDAVEDTTAQTDENLQKQINDLSTQLGEALELIGFLQVQLADANASISDLQSRVGQLESDLAALQSDPVFALSGFLSDFANYVTTDLDLVDIDGDGTPEILPKIVFEDVNVQIVNGMGRTDRTNGLGNLFVGYNNHRGSNTTEVCSAWGFYGPTTCQNNNGVWGTNHKSGSHNIVGGDFNAYSGYGGVVFGILNAITAPYAVVTAGLDNIATESYASVSGGANNMARGGWTSISGGSDHDAQGLNSSISGGQDNTTLANWASVSGGQFNAAAADWASVSGGTINNAFANHSSVSGGQGAFTLTPVCWQGGTLADTC